MTLQGRHWNDLNSEADHATGIGGPGPGDRDVRAEHTRGREAVRHGEAELPGLVPAAPAGFSSVPAGGILAQQGLSLKAAK